MVNRKLDQFMRGTVIMSKRIILSKLKNKNIYPVSVEYLRGCPTPYGYTDGWDIEFSDECVDYIYDTYKSSRELENFMEFDTLKNVLDWVEGL